jgi:tRNA pseudouridine65 synthase
MTPQLLYQDQNMIAVYKPSGFHVHPPQDRQFIPREKILLYQMRDLLGQYLYPVHRLDAGTSGVMVFALHKQAAHELAQQFQTQNVKKTYFAVVRGYVPEQGTIDIPLPSDSSPDLLAARTDFVTVARLKLNQAVGKRNPTARYSLVQVFPRSGRFHQIRRHFARKSHPVIGEAAHGDSKHNRFFRENLDLAGLCLRSAEISLPVSWQAQPVQVTAPLCSKWQKIHALFGEFIR